MGEDGAFGDSGRAAGGAELVDVVLVDGDGRRAGRGLADQPLQVQVKAVVAAEADDVLDRGHVGQPGAGGLGEVGVDQDGDRLDVGQVRGDLVRRVADVGGRADDARLRRGEEELDVLSAVRGEDREPVALGESEGGQGAREPVGADIQVRPGPGGAPRHHDGRLVSEEHGVAANDVADQHPATPRVQGAGSAPLVLSMRSL